MKPRFFPTAVLPVLLLLGVWACDSGTSPTEITSADAAAQAARGGEQSPQLNLSHIECVDGAVEVHFVLLFASDSDPGDLTYTNDGNVRVVPRGKNTGNVWHYTDSGLPNGDYDVTAASVTLADGTVVTLHNPGDYSGAYDCSETCPLPDPEPLLCFEPSSLGNPAAECALFGLVPLGKDDGLTGATHVASMDAALAIVKNGRGTCEAGENAYRTYTNVGAGDLLAQPTGSGDISHVTYCGCAG